MTVNEAKALSAYAFQMFPDLKPAQTNFLREQMLPFDRIAVMTTLKIHRAGHDFFNFPQFFEGCRTQHEYSKKRLEAYEKQTVAQWLAGQAKYAGLDAAILLHYADAWKAVESDPTAGQYGKQSMRKLIRSHCRDALMEIGWNSSDARRQAQECVGLGRDENLVIPPASGPLAEAVKIEVAQLVGAK